MAKEQQFVKNIANIEEDFPQWYTDVVIKTELVDYGPVKGTMVIRPYGYAIWENIQKELNRRFSELGVQNAYFPMLIPESYLMREAEHVEGFAPEVALVTHAGGEKLAENLVVRPTSETIICEMFSKWMQSYRDLPIKINQWANVMRWEKTTRPFLRTSEFLWQEGHTAYATEEEAREDAQKMLKCYSDFAHEFLAIPVFTGVKTEKEKFAGAVETYGMEAMMLDGKSLQAGTTHYLGNNFAKAFNMKFLDKNNALQYAFSTSWGVSTRLIGAIVMAHGDQRGLSLPPKVAPIQVVVIPVAQFKEGVLEKANEITDKLAKMGIRVKLDARDASPGWKFNEWEMKGCPLRLEIGPRDIQENKCVLSTRYNCEKFTLSLDELDTIPALLETIQQNMLEKSRKMRDSKVVEASTLDEIFEGVENKNFVKAHWCGCRECEDAIKNRAAATSRVIVEDAKEGTVCAVCGKKAEKVVLFARAY
ncbi:MAG: proline--tRNA ligase [Clostridia bacterium]|nr:proline--tRNA ligase [Clostridia bacterium]